MKKITSFVLGALMLSFAVCLVAMNPGVQTFCPIGLNYGARFDGAGSNSPEGGQNLYVRCYTDSDLVSGDVVTWHNDDTTINAATYGYAVSQASAANYSMCGVSIDTYDAGGACWIQVRGYNGHINVGATAAPVNSVLMPVVGTFAAANITGGSVVTGDTHTSANYIRTLTGNGSAAGFVSGMIHTR